ncbi:MAG: carbohydrate porin [bacterium]
MKRVLLSAALLAVISFQSQLQVVAAELNSNQSEIVSPFKLTNSIQGEQAPQVNQNIKFQYSNAMPPAPSNELNVSNQIKTGVSKDEIQLKLQEEQVPHKENVLKAWVKQDRATGNWHGLRGKLEDHGLSFEGYYYMDNLLKTRGGYEERKNGKKAMLLPYLYYGATLDTEKAGLWKGGTFYTAAELYGKTGMSLDEIGDTADVTSLDGYTQRHQLTQYWYQQKLFNNHYRIKIGRDSTLNEFDYQATRSSFVNFGMVDNPMLTQAYLLPATPYAGFGILNEIKPTDNTSLKVGVYEGSPKPGTHSPAGFFNGRGHYVTAMEAAYTPTIKDHSGKYYLGSYIHSANWEKVYNGDLAHSNRGLYLGFEQKITNEKHDAEQGLTINSRFGKCPSDRNLITAYYSLGATYKGLIPKRDKDLLGVSWYYANLSRDSKNLSSEGGTKMHDEKAIETFYNFAVTPWFSIQPDFQYVVKPGGTGCNATIFGLRTVFTF